MKSTHTYFFKTTIRCISYSTHAARQNFAQLSNPEGLAASAAATPGGVEPRVNRNCGFLPGLYLPPGFGRVQTGD